MYYFTFYLGDVVDTLVETRRDVDALRTMITADDEINVCMVLLVILLAIYHNSLRQRNYLKRQALVDAKKSAWQQLLEHGDSSSFLLLTGVSRRAFYMLLDIAIPPGHRVRRRRRRKGRQWSLSAEGQLGLLLFIWAARCHTSICVFFLESHHQHVLGC